MSPLLIRKTAKHQFKWRSSACTLEENGEAEGTGLSERGTKERGNEKSKSRELLITGRRRKQGRLPSNPSGQESFVTLSLSPASPCLTCRRTPHALHLPRDRSARRSWRASALTGG